MTDSLPMTLTPTATANRAEQDAAVFDFHGVSFDPLQRTSRTFGFEKLDHELDDAATFCWVDVMTSDIECLNELLRRRHIDLVLESHFSGPEILPRIVERPECLA